MLCDFQGIRTSIAKRPFKFVIFQGGGGSGPLSPPLDPRMQMNKQSTKVVTSCKQYGQSFDTVKQKLDQCFTLIERLGTGRRLSWNALKYTEQK